MREKNWFLKSLRQNDIAEQRRLRDINGQPVSRLPNISFFLTEPNSNIWPFTVTNTLAKSLNEISDALKRMHNSYVKEKL